MDNCCNYYLIEIKQNNMWISLSFVSKDLSEINNYIVKYFQENGSKEYRIVQRSIKKDREKRKVPQCC